MSSDRRQRINELFDQVFDASPHSLCGGRQIAVSPGAGQARYTAARFAAAGVGFS